MIDAINWSVIFMGGAEDTRMKLEGDDNRSSKVEMEPSRSIRCGGGKTFKNMATSYRTDHGHLPGGYLSSLCQPCSSGKCIVYRCITTKVCQYINGSPTTCTSSEDCQPVSSNWSDYKTLLYIYRVFFFAFSMVIRFTCMFVCCHIYSHIFIGCKIFTLENRVAHNKLNMTNQPSASPLFFLGKNCFHFFAGNAVIVNRLSQRE